MRSLAVVVIVVAGVLASPGLAAARPCADQRPFVVGGVSLIVYTNDDDSPFRTTCRTARRVVRAFLSTGRSPTGWRCRDSSQFRRCVGGGTFVDEDGHRQWRRLAGWHGVD